MKLVQLRHNHHSRKEEATRVRVVHRERMKDIIRRRYHRRVIHDEFQQQHGTLILGGGRHYEGEYRNGKRHGRGVTIWSDGTRFEGTTRCTP